MDLPPTQPIPVVDPEVAVEFLARLRAHTQRADSASRLLGDQA